MKTNRSFLIVAALGVSLAASVFAQSSRVADNAPPPPPAGGSGTYFRLDYPGSTEPNQLQTAVSYLLWVPEGVTQLRGLIVHQHGAGTTASIEGSTGAYDLQWQALAKKWDCALWSSSYHVQNEAVDLTPGGSEHWFDPRRGSEKTFLKALDEFSAKSGHSELAKVPWILWGHSGGGIWADVMTTLHPERVVAVWMRSGSAEMFRPRSEFPQPQVPHGAYNVPEMGNPGAKEGGPYTGTLATFKQYRLKGSPVGFAPDPRTGHECGDSRYLAIPYLDACMAMRLPDKGSTDQTLKPVDMSHAWLAALVEKDPQNAAAVPAAEYKGNPLEAVWLPNEAVAKAWVEYVKTGAVSDTTPPPAPFDVKASKGETGVEITWNAAADFESGIRNFIVLRDGQELASVPERPIGRFGRPLFQSMTYHDTPGQPLPEMRYVDSSAKPGEKHTYAVVSVNSVGLKSAPSAEASQLKEPSPPTQPAMANSQVRDYRFDGSISRQVLENYLDRSISYTELLHDDLSQPRNRMGVDPRDNLRFILNTGAKFVGRALMCWGRERELDTLLRNAKTFAAELHKADPDIVLQGAAFEIVTRGVESVAIPEYVFKEFGLPVVQRNFVFADIGYPTGTHRMGNGNIPDMNQLEARMWFFYLCSQYIDAGIEAIHFGQIGLMDQNDRQHVGWVDMLDRVRAYAHAHARRHFVICDAHTANGGFLKDGKLLFDVHAFPLRIAQDGDQPLKGKLQVGYTDALFLKSKGGITPSGWSCEHLPYLVEFDNFGGRNQGQSSAGTIFVWGYDEITWFSVLPEAERNQWLHYAWKWIKETDPNGHLEMPGSRVITPARNSGGPRWYWANTRSDACPNGSNTEQTIREIWAADSARK